MDTVGVITAITVVRVIDAISVIAVIIQRQRKRRRKGDTGRRITMKMEMSRRRMKNLLSTSINYN